MTVTKFPDDHYTELAYSLINNKF